MHKAVALDIISPYLNVVISSRGLRVSERRKDTKVSYLIIISVFVLQGNGKANERG